MNPQRINGRIVRELINDKTSLLHNGIEGAFVEDLGDDCLVLLLLKDSQCIALQTINEKSPFQFFDRGAILNFRGNFYLSNNIESQNTNGFIYFLKPLKINYIPK